MVRIFQRNDRSPVGWHRANPSGGENRPDSDIYFISTEGYLYDSKDNKAIFNATGALVNRAANVDGGKIVLTKPVSVKIMAQSDNGSDYE